MKQSKIAIIGAGRVGTTTAYALMLKNIASEILLVDVDPIRCNGEILDLTDAIPFSTTSIIKEATLQEAAQADIILITAGKAQKPGQSRLDLVKTNIDVINNIVAGLTPIHKNALIIVISNPLDILTYHLQSKNILPKNQVFGSGTFLDTIRLQKAIAEKLHVPISSINTYVLGEHGDTQFPTWSLSSCNGKPLTALLSHEECNKIADQTKKKAYDIIACKGATFYGIATCIAIICDSIVYNKKLVIPVSCYQQEFDIYLSMPCVISATGIKEYPVALNELEQELLKKSALSIKSAMQT